MDLACYRTKEFHESARMALDAIEKSADSGQAITVKKEHAMFMDACRDWLVERGDPRWNGVAITDVYAFDEFCRFAVNHM